ncbi:MAG TPA: hypothetical protein VGM90_41255 [Kofleriaceae bacterium]
MRFAIHAMVLSVAVPAAAQPVTRPAQLECAVDIVLAPDGAREAIQQWVASEPRCVRHLAVRVVPTDGGLYLSAQDGSKLRERVVPDAQSAALLVVSWMADDSLGTLPVPEMSDAEPAPFATTVSRRYTPAEQSRSLIVGGTAVSDSRAGVRAQIDLLQFDRFSIGAAAGWLGSVDRHRGMDGATDTVQARLLAAVTFQRGRWTLRGQVGVGADVVGQSGGRMDGDESKSGVSPHVEAGAILQFDISHGLGIVGGPLVDASLGDGNVNGGGFLGVRVGL